MGQAVTRFFMLVALVASTAYLLQTDDSLRPSPVSAAAPEALQMRPIEVAHSDSTGREYFIRRQEIVPLGISTLKLPILMYHYIRPQPSQLWDPMGYRLSVPPDVFTMQLDWLSAHGYHTVTFAEVRAYFAGTTPLPSRPVIITLDDGYQDLYSTAYQVLRVPGLTAVAYIVTSFVGQAGYVTRDQVLEMDRNGIQIASHTVRHPDLSHASSGNTAYELTQSKLWLEQLLGHPVLDFAYPSGKFNAQAIQAVRLAGYDTAVTTQASITHSALDRYVWGRVRVGGGESMEEFVTNLGVSMPSIMITSVKVKSGG